MYRDSPRSMTPIKIGFNEFQWGCKTIFDETRHCAPKTATKKNNLARVHDVVFPDGRLKVYEIAERLSIWENRMSHIWNEQFGT